ncbi:transporter [Acinetobacter sp. ACNIH2]|uniref:ComEA family DNA-binding protein n=1 Tax=Acinetobacter sp. ACNIH2 TaxID=1758189 RepID=UPI000CDCC443|nr:transporter [Acinetobacter sp. ACNIH2]
MNFNAIRLLRMVVLLTLTIFGFDHVNAQNFDQEYLNWKAKQQAQDARLGSSRTDGSYYLSKPSLNTVSGNKIRLNSATSEQLQQLSGIGEKKAEAILQYRQQHGKFKTVDELQQVKGIGPKLLQKNKDRLTL